MQVGKVENTGIQDQVEHGNGFFVTCAAELECGVVVGRFDVLPCAGVARFHDGAEHFRILYRDRGTMDAEAAVRHGIMFLLDFIKLRVGDDGIGIFHFQISRGNGILDKAGGDQGKTSGELHTAVEENSAGVGFPIIVHGSTVVGFHESGNFFRNGGCPFVAEFDLKRTVVVDGDDVRIKCPHEGRDVAAAGRVGVEIAVRHGAVAVGVGVAGACVFVEGIVGPFAAVDGFVDVREVQIVRLREIHEHTIGVTEAGDTHGAEEEIVFAVDRKRIVGCLAVPRLFVVDDGDVLPVQEVVVRDHAAGGDRLTEIELVFVKSRENGVGEHIGVFVPHDHTVVEFDVEPFFDFAVAGIDGIVDRVSGHFAVVAGVVDVFVAGKSGEGRAVVVF